MEQGEGKGALKELRHICVPTPCDEYNHVLQARTNKNKNLKKSTNRRKICPSINCGYL